MNIQKAFGILLITVFISITITAHAQDAFDQAAESASIAGHSLSKVHRWLHEIALPKIDAKTGLYKAHGKWDYRDTAADCYPFFTWAAFVVDKEVFNGPVRNVLHREIALCNRVKRIPVPWDFETGAQVENLDWEEMVFQASEYVKDGLIAIVEATGYDEWFDRMRAIEDDIWSSARVVTPFGNIPSENIEVNGEQLQALARLFSMTGDEKYLDWGDRLIDYYFDQDDFVPTRLRDHGCEIIGGLGLLHAVETTHRPQKAKEYEAKMQHVFDVILKKGCNDDGMMFNKLGDHDSRLSDGWGYNYVGLLCYDMATGTEGYKNNIVSTLKNLSKPFYQDYKWEGESIDGFADSIEGALYLLNRLPVQEGMMWVNRETKNNLVDHPSRLENGELWGTMKLQANGVRTVLIHALMHTQGIIARPWKQGLELGAALQDNGVAIVLQGKEDYEGVLEFDLPRHRVYMGFEKDWPRMNTLPEWFTVEPEKNYLVQTPDSDIIRRYTGRQLHAGLEVTVKAGNTLKLKVIPIP